MPTILEPVSAGIIVALLNKYVVSKFDFCYPCQLVAEIANEKNHEDDVSSTSTTVTDFDTSTHAHVVHFST